jgi:DNA-binding NtrC family response regulator
MASKLASGRVLIADDGPQIREWLRDSLTGEGYEVVTVATGAQALETVPTFHPDVIVLDMVLPDLSGTDVLAALRRGGLTMPVILISGHEITVREGFFGVLQKPLRLRRLAEVVAAAMSHVRPPGA